MSATRMRFSPLRFIPLFLLGFLFALMTSPADMYTAEFLTSRGFSTQFAGYAYMLASVSGIVMLILLPSMLKRSGARATLMRFTLMLGIGAFSLAVIPSQAVTLVAFLFFLSAQMILYALLDFFLEAKVDGFEGITGRVRGAYLFVINLTFTSGPFIGALIISQYSFDHIYLFVALMSIVYFAYAYIATRGFDDAQYPRITLRYLVRTLIKDRTISSILSINFLLQVRFVASIVYLVIYLHQGLGFSLASIGIMLTIAHIPYFLIQFPLGVIADRWFGEKELLVAGFVVTCTGAFMLAFMPIASVIVTTGIISLMFTGGAMVEIMAESYFFKHVRSKDDAHIVAFRMTRPAAYIVTPLIAGAVLIALPLNFVFAAVGALCLLGIPISLSLKDTR